MVKLGSKAQRELKDYNLSRFACYLVAQNGDPRKPEIAAAQVYFAVTTRAHEIHQLRMEQERRLETRLRVSEGFKQLASAAGVAGILSENFGLFVDAGYLGLHHATIEELKAKKGVPPQEDYLDNIGREELSAIDFKNTQTEGKLRHDQVDNEDTAIKTHFFVGGEVRKAIEAIHAPMPEDLPPAPSIRKMVEERRKAARKRRGKAEQRHDQPSLLDSGDEP
jgi:DNA-damage-inducible protein D